MMEMRPVVAKWKKNDECKTHCLGMVSISGALLGMPGLEPGGWYYGERVPALSGTCI